MVWPPTNSEAKYFALDLDEGDQPVLDWKILGVYALSDLNGDRFMRIKHESGADIEIPGHVLVTKDWFVGANWSEGEAVLISPGKHISVNMAPYVGASGLDIFKQPMALVSEEGQQQFKQDLQQEQWSLELDVQRSGGSCCPRHCVRSRCVLCLRTAAA